MSASVSTKDLLGGLLVIFIWALNSAVIKFITIEVPPFTGLALRFVLACAIFAAFFRPLAKDKFSLMLQITILLAVLHWSTLIWGIDKLDISTANIVLQTQVIFATFLGWLMFKEKIGWRTTAGMLCGIAGVIILVGLPKEPPSLIGVIVLLFSMLMLASSYTRQKLLTDVSPLNYIAHLHLLGLIPVIALAFAFEKPAEVEWQNINLLILVPCLLFQVFIVSGAHTIWQRLMNRNQLSILPNLTLLLPILGVILGIIFFDETLHRGIIFGGLLTMAGVGIIMFRQQKKQRIKGQEQ